MGFLDRINANLDLWLPAFKQSRNFKRVTRTVLGLLASHGRSTVTNAITSQGREQ